MAGGKEQYVYRLMEAKCSWGDQKFSQKLNVKKDHGIVFSEEGQPLMNANDHVQGENIFTFGRCFPKHDIGYNPNSIRALEMQTGEKIDTTFFSPIAGTKCQPKTFVPWLIADEDNVIDGAPAITLKSKLPCYCGGVISITLVKEDDDDSQDSDTDDDTTEETQEEKSKMELLPSEVQEKIDSFCDDEPTNSVAKGAETLAAEQKGLIDPYGVPEVNSIIGTTEPLFPTDGRVEFNLNETVISPYMQNDTNK